MVIALSTFGDTDCDVVVVAAVLLLLLLLLCCCSVVAVLLLLLLCYCVVSVVGHASREFKQIATAGATTAAVTEKVWGEHVAAVCQILAK